MGKGWSKGGNRQRKPTFHPCKGYEGWEKGGQKVGIVRESPPFAHAKGMKGGERVDKSYHRIVIPMPSFIEANDV